MANDLFNPKDLFVLSCCVRKNSDMFPSYSYIHPQRWNDLLDKIKRLVGEFVAHN